MEILEKVRNILKSTFNSKVIYSRNYLQLKRKQEKNTKRGFQCLYVSVILIDSVYRKDGNYHPKVFLEKYYFIEDIEIYCSDSDEVYYDEQIINLFFVTLKK